MPTQDLSQLQQRQQSQGRSGGDIAAPRDASAGNIQVYADQRNAYRADSSDEVRRALGLVNQTVSNIGDIQENQTLAAIPGDRAKASLDQASGAAPDPAMAKSVAYQDAYYGAKATATVNSWQSDTTQAVDDAINQGASPDDVHKLVMAKATELRDTALADYPTDNAKQFIGGSLARYASQLDVAVAKKFKAKTDQDLLDTVGQNAVTSAFTPPPPTPTAAAPGAKPEADPVIALLGSPDATPAAMPFALSDVTDMVHGFGGKVTSTLRTPQQQAALIAAGATSAEHSYHLTGQAVDFVPPAGMTLATAKAQFAAAGYDVKEALDESGKGPNQGTGRHFHFAFGPHVNGPASDSTEDSTDTPAAPAAPAPALYAHIGQQFELAMGAARAAGIDPKTAKANFVQAFITRATDPTDPQPEAMLALARSTQADGKTPSFTPAEQQEIQNAAITGFNQRKAKENRETQAAQDDLLPKLYDKVTKGEDVSAIVDKAVADQTITAAEGLAWRSHARSAMEQQTRGEVDYPTVTGFQVDLAQPDADVAGIRSKIVAAYNSGGLGTGTSADRAFASLMNRAKERRAPKVSGPDAEAGRQYVNNVLHVDRYDLQGPENKATADIVLQAHGDYNKRLGAGEDPSKAAHEVADLWGPRLDASTKRGPALPPAAAGNPKAAQIKATTNAQASALIRQQAAERARLLAQLQHK